MIKFSDLSEPDKIQYIKDGFIILIENLYKNPSKLKEYIKLEKPNQLVVNNELIIDSMSEFEKKVIEEKNKVLQEKVNIENEKIMAAFKLKEEQYKKIETILSKIQKKEGCLCGSCIDINITNSSVPPELHLFIDIARKEAEERTY